MAVKDASRLPMSWCLSRLAIRRFFIKPCGVQGAHNDLLFLISCWSALLTTMPVGDASAPLFPPGESPKAASSSPFLCTTPAIMWRNP